MNVTGYKNLEGGLENAEVFGECVLRTIYLSATFSW